MPEILNNLLLGYKNSGMQDATISIPLLELIILLLLMTGCLLLRFSKTGLVVAFLFVYRWGWIFCLHGAFLDVTTRTMCHVGYIVFGILVVTLTVVAMILSKHYSSEE